MEMASIRARLTFAIEVEADNGILVFQFVSPSYVTFSLKVQSSTVAVSTYLYRQSWHQDTQAHYSSSLLSLFSP